MSNWFHGWARMSAFTVPREYQDALEKQRHSDLLARQLPGLLFYPAIWAVVGAIMILMAPDKAKIVWVLSILAALVVNACARYWLMQKEATTTHRYLLLDLGIGATGLVWSAIICFTLLNTPLRPHYALVITATMGLVAGAVVTIAIRQRTVDIFLSCLFAMPTLVSLSGYSSQPTALSALFLVFGLAMRAITRLPRGEYERAVVTNFQLQDQALQLMALSQQDALTGLRNRRYFDAQMEQELKRAQRLNYPFTLLIIDIDHFKHINDRHGHVIGDKCLQHVATCLRQGLQRAADSVARIGGEEFGAVLPGVDEAEGVRSAERLLRYINQTPFSVEGTTIPLTVSIGGVTAPPNRVANTETILKQADAALYRSKQNGRNRISWAVRKKSSQHVFH